MISKELQAKLDFYEQIYYALDKPIPFRGNLYLHPVKVEDYYTFYASLPCLTMDKNIKYEYDELGREIKVSNPQGIAQSYLAYLIERMEDKTHGQNVTAQVMQLFELVFKIKRGFYCPNCGKEIGYDEVIGKIDEYVQAVLQEAQGVYEKQFSDEEEHKIPKEIVEAITQKAKMEGITQSLKCECGGDFRDIFSIKNSGPIKKLVVKDVELSPQDFEELKAIIPRQNILDYDGDKYIDPDLKEELEIKAKL